MVSRYVVERLCRIIGLSIPEVAHRVLIPERVDVRDVRQRLNMTQKEFAQFFGFSVYSIRNWEQGKRQPEGPARVLLTVYRELNKTQRLTY